jgi:hypothetical protein
MLHGKGLAFGNKKGQALGFNIAQHPAAFVWKTQAQK